MTDLNKAVQIKPDYFLIYYYRASIHFKRGNYRMAIDDFNKAIELNPNDADSYVERALAFDKINETAKAG